LRIAEKERGQQHVVGRVAKTPNHITFLTFAYGNTRSRLLREAALHSCAPQSPSNKMLLAEQVEWSWSVRARASQTISEPDYSARYLILDISCLLLLNYAAGHLVNLDKYV
jgi:hypothetical protein